MFRYPITPMNIWIQRKKSLVIEVSIGFMSVISWDIPQETTSEIPIMLCLNVITICLYTKHICDICGKICIKLSLYELNMYINFPLKRILLSKKTSKTCSELKHGSALNIKSFCHIEYSFHYDVIKWKHFPRYWQFVRGIHRSPVNSLYKGQWGGALMFSLICTQINGWVNNGKAGDLRRQRAHYDVTVMHDIYNDHLTKHDKLWLMIINV